MRALLLGLLLLATVTTVSLATPSASATDPIGGSWCSGATDSHCYYMLCLGAEKDPYGYYHCKTPIYWPCQYCVPI